MIYFILFGIGILFIYLDYKFIYYLAKKSNYNCNKCKVFDCPAKHCHFIISSNGFGKKYCEEVILNDKRK